MKNPNFRTLEQQLLAEIAAKDREIAFLTSERAALERVLFSARKRALGNEEVTRSNSVGRVMAENAILKKLDDNGKGMVDVQVLEAAARGAVPGLGQSTFRSHLHRLKERGLIEAPRRGKWRRAQQQSPFSVGDFVRHPTLGMGSVTGVNPPSAIPDQNLADGVRSTSWTFDVEWFDEENGEGVYTDRYLTLVHRAFESR